MTKKSTNERLYGTGLVETIRPESRGPLRDKHLIPPFSIWNTRDRGWMDRKRRWTALGIKSDSGRDDKLTYNIPLLLKDGSTGRKIENQTSIFDPVCCELCYSWWCPPGGTILDPFAGGSVRGIVASVMGMRYMGFDISQTQIDANKAQLTEENTGDYKPKWVCGDSREVLETKAPQADFVFSCPPYGDLEKYSDDPKDISNMTYGEFREAYEDIIGKACGKLKEDRFACFVVGNFRGDKGVMRDFVGDTIRCFRKAGLAYFNDIVLVNSVGSAAMRANTSFIRGHRKVVKVHQNVLVFIKGDPKQAANAIAPTPQGEEE